MTTLDNPFLTGLMETAGKQADTANLEWNAAPFEGVSLKHLLTGQGTGGSLSLHLVRIEPGCAIGDHAHQAEDELHLVLEGRGVCLMEGEPLDYAPGTGRFVPKGQAHEVRAGDSGLLLAALFTPALL